MEKLSEANPEINKKRPIYMSGGSFAATMLPGFSLILLENGWNVVGHINESAFVDIDEVLHYYTDEYYRRGTISYLTYQFTKFFGDLTRYGIKNDIYGAREMAWFAELLPVAGISDKGMVHCSTDSRGGKLQEECINFWFYMQNFVTNDDVREQFKGGNEDMFIVNFDVHDYYYLGSKLAFWQYNKRNYDRLFNEFNYKMVILQGVFDPYYTVKHQLQWIDKLKYSENVKFSQADWQTNEFGNYKKSGNLCFQVVQAGHITQIEKPQVAYTQMKNLINTGQVCA